MDLEDRYKCVFVGFGRVHWIRVEMGTYSNVLVKIWMALSGFVWIWGVVCRILLDLSADSCGFLNWILFVLERFSGIMKGFGWI